MGKEKPKIAIEILFNDEKVFCYYSDDTVLLTKDFQKLEKVKSQLEESIKYLNGYLQKGIKPKEVSGTVSYPDTED